MCPASAVPLKEDGTTNSVLARTYYQVGLVVAAEIVWVTEVGGIAAWDTCDGVGGELLEVEELLVGRASKSHGSACVVHTGIDEPGLAFGDVRVVDHCATPAALDVVRLVRIEGDRFLFPCAEIGGGDMSPMQTRHIWTIAVLLEEDVVLAVLVGNSVGLVGPVGRWHTVEVRTQNVVFKVLEWYAQIHLLACQLASSLCHL